MLTFLQADKKVEVFATSIDTNSSYLKASDDVVVLYDGLYVSAESATYDRDSEVLELFGNVVALQGSQYYAMGDYLMLNTKEDSRQFRPFFLQQHSDNLWISARSAKSKAQKYELHSGIVSSCNPQNPDWTVRFSSGYYDDDDQWMQLYNARLYAGEVPVFYFPYFAYPTDTTRRSGLLRPTFGLSSDEGFMYQQPIYIAEDPRWDLELLPQIRTERGQGLYSILRFTDSPKSTGSFVLGGFKEQSSYQEAFNLQNDQHYGAEFDYQHRDFLKTWFDWGVGGSSGIYSDVTYLNDVEYLNLKENDSLDYSTDSQVTSKVNLFLNQSEDYFGSYFKYFIDLNKESNSDTIQRLPALQYHHYLNTFFDDHFMYSINYRGTNFYRETRKSAIQNELSVPLELQFPLFDEYVTLTLSENLYATHISFYGSGNSNDPNDPASPYVQEPSNGYSPGIYARDVQVVQVNSTLVKSFDDFTHSMSLTAGYQHPGTEKRTGFYDDYQAEFDEIRADNVRCDAGPCEYDTIEDVLEQGSLEFTQYVFTAENGEKLYHRLKQPLIYEQGYDKYGDLENELRYFITREFNFYNNTFYNYDRNVISKTQNSIGYNNTVFIANLSHLYEDKLVQDQATADEERLRTRYMTADARYNYSQRWQYFAGYAYDIENSETKNRNLGFLYNKRCWSVQLKYVENIRPTLSTVNGVSETSSIKDQVLYLTVNLRPLGGMEVDYKSSENR
jgi:LPS-assembly protein